MISDPASDASTCRVFWFDGVFQADGAMPLVSPLRADWEGTGGGRTIFIRPEMCLHDVHELVVLAFLGCGSPSVRCSWVVRFDGERWGRNGSFVSEVQAMV